MELVVFGLVSGLVLGIVPSISGRSRIIGITCIVFNILMYGSPLTIIVSTSIVNVPMSKLRCKITMYNCFTHLIVNSCVTEKGDQDKECKVYAFLAFSCRHP